MENGGTRNFEPWKAAEEKELAAKQARDTEESGDVMKQLENKTKDSKLEMDALEALDELKTMNALRATVDPEDVIAERLALTVRLVLFRSSRSFVCSVLHTLSFFLLFMSFLLTLRL